MSETAPLPAPLLRIPFPQDPDRYVRIRASRAWVSRRLEELERAGSQGSFSLPERERAVGFMAHEEDSSPPGPLCLPLAPEPQREPRPFASPSDRRTRLLRPGRLAWEVQLSPWGTCLRSAPISRALLLHARLFTAPAGEMRETFRRLLAEDRALGCQLLEHGVQYASPSPPDWGRRALHPFLQGEDLAPLLASPTPAHRELAIRFAGSLGRTRTRIG